MAFSSNKDVGIEAFALLEEHCICQKPSRRASRQTRETINCDQAALKYGGFVIAEYRVKKPPVVPAPPAPPLRYFY